MRMVIERESFLPPHPRVPPMRFRGTVRAAFVTLALVAFACGPDAPEGTEPEGGHAVPVAGTGPAAGVSATAGVPTKLASLVADIRAGIAPLATEVGDAPEQARQRAVELYVTRQEEIERQWGEGGELDPSPGLAEAVAEAERRFHRLMELLSAASPPDSASVAEATAALDEGLAEVLARAGEGGAR